MASRSPNTSPAASARRPTAPSPRSSWRAILSRRCMPSPLADRWTLDPGVVFLNHGSFGACPREVLAAQAEWRARMERQPVQFLWRDLPGLLDAAREELAKFIKVEADDLVFVANATAGVSAVVRSLRF